MSAAASPYRPQLGVLPPSGPGQQFGNGAPNSNERDDRGRNQGYIDSAMSPLSPSTSSDYSFSKYQPDMYAQQPRNNNPSSYGNDTVPHSGSSSIMSRRSSMNNGAPDSVVVEHYIALKRYLTRHLSGEGGLNQRQNKAREKLVRLSKQQFSELSTDVYDELMRRQNTQMSQPFLIPKESFHPKRNQARQKLATLPPGRFKELASDVLYEIERRYPPAVDAAIPYFGSEESILRNSTSSFGSQRSDQNYPRNDNISPAAPRDRFPSTTSSNNLSIQTIPEEPPEIPSAIPAIQKTGMQTSIIPSKSTMVEEDGPDDEGDDGELFPISQITSNRAPVQKTFMSNTIVPNTSTMVEEEVGEAENVDENPTRTSTFTPSTGGASTKSLSPVFQSSTFAIANNVNGTKTRSISPPPVLPRARTQEELQKEQEIQERMEQYEDKIEALRERIAELQGDLKKAKEELRQEKAKSPPPPPTPPPPPSPPVNNLRMRELETENERLKEELREQQEVTNDVRREATELLEEMKSMTVQQDTLFETQNNSAREIARLQTEIRDWKSRYSQLKVQLRSTTSSIGSSSHLNSPIRMDIKSRIVPAEDGVIEDGSISRFQNSIDDLLAAARRDDTEVLDVMTEVVKATRAITDDLRRYGSRNLEDDPKVRKLTTRLSATANNLITAAKNHVSSQGLSPVSLVDAAASHLTSTVVDLVKVVKMRPSSGTTFRTDDDAQSDQSRYSEIATPLTSPMGPKSSPKNSKQIPGPLNLGGRSNLAPRSSALRDDLYTPRSPESPRSMDSRSSHRSTYPGKDEEELRIYLDNQTQAIVESIQSLLTRIRNPKLDSLDDFRPQIDEIVSIVEKIVEYTEGQTTKIDRLGRDNGRLMTILHSLEDCCGLMRNVSSNPSDDAFKKRLARIAFDISKQIKELVRIVEAETPANMSSDLL